MKSQRSFAFIKPILCVACTITTTLLGSAMVVAQTSPAPPGVRNPYPQDNMPNVPSMGWPEPDHMPVYNPDVTAIAVSCTMTVVEPKKIPMSGSLQNAFGPQNFIPATPQESMPSIAPKAVPLQKLPTTWPLPEVKVGPR